MEAENREGEEMNKKLDDLGQGINVRGKSSMTRIILVCKPPCLVLCPTCSRRAVFVYWMKEEECDPQKLMGGQADVEVVSGKGRNKEPVHEPC